MMDKCQIYIILHSAQQLWKTEFVKVIFMLQASKKLKMEEKDMREAKSVLKHKMADMLNVLHPDTSNEAS